VLFMSDLKINISQILPFGLVRSMAGVNPLIINYHVVSDRNLPHVINLYKYRDVRTFGQDLDFLAANYHPIGLHELLAHMKNGARLPRNSCLITFDDGFKEVYETAAPILAEKGISATFFITRDFIDNSTLGFDGKKSLIMEHLLSGVTVPNELKEIVKGDTSEELMRAIGDIPYSERNKIDSVATLLQINFGDYLKKESPYLTSQQIIQLIREGFTIGSHALDHANFMQLTIDEQLHQAISGTHHLCEKFSLDYKVFAFPYSDSGISHAFFKGIHGKIDATFGNQGLMTDCIPENFQRISYEKTGVSASKMTRFFYTRKIIKSLFRNNAIHRQ
jgi:peptidoglycan/xylan/chitin deacetylase (PgdA/CDA1 family)